MEDVRTLTQWRKDRVITLRELAEKAGVTQQTLVNISAGAQTRMSTMKKVAGALGVDVHAIEEFRRILSDE